jgi:peroxiredoxin
MKVLVGSKAPSLAGARDQRGNPVSLEGSAGRHVLLVFLRYASCPMCLLQVRELGQRHLELRDAGIEVIAVFHSPPSRIARHTSRLALPFPVITDPGRTLYVRYGVGSSWLGLGASAILPSFYVAFARAMRFGFWGGAVDGELARMPADFLISPDRRVCAAHYGRSIGDHLPLDEIKRLVNAASPATADIA